MIWPSSISSIRASSRARICMGVRSVRLKYKVSIPDLFPAGKRSLSEHVMVLREEARAHVVGGAQREQPRAFGERGAGARLRDRFETQWERRQREVDDRADGDAAHETETCAEHSVEPFEPRVAESRTRELTEYEARYQNDAADKKKAARVCRLDGLDEADASEECARSSVEVRREYKADDESEARDERAHEPAQSARGHRRPDDCKHEHVEYGHRNFGF